MINHKAYASIRKLKYKNLTDKIMAKICTICERGAMRAGGYSNRTRAEKFNPTGIVRKQLNLQWAQMMDGKRKKICTRCLKGHKNLENNSK